MAVLRFNLNLESLLLQLWMGVCDKGGLRKEGSDSIGKYGGVTVLPKNNERNERRSRRETRTLCSEMTLCNA